MLKYKQIWYGIKPIRWLIKFNLTPAMNNKAEYEAILTSLRIAKALGVKILKLRTNSKLSVGQITNEYEGKEERMKRYLKIDESTD